MGSIAPQRTFPARLLNSITSARFRILDLADLTSAGPQSVFAQRRGTA